MQNLEKKSDPQNNAEELAKQEQGLESPEKISKEVDPAEQREEEKERLDKVFDLASKDAEETTQKIEELASSMGIEDSDTMETASSKYLKEIEAQKKNFENNNIEDEPDPGSFKEERFSREFNIDSLKEELNELAKESRENYVKDMIKITIEEGLKSSESMLNECKNKEIAEHIMKTSLAAAITEKTANWVETGERDESLDGGTYYFTTNSYEIRNQKIQYVTGFVIEHHDGTSFVVGGDRKIDGISLVNGSQQQQLDKAKKSGDLNEEKEKINKS